MVESQFCCEWQHAEIEKTLTSQPRQHIKKKRHYFAKKVYIVKPMIFPVVMNGCESWTMKKAEHRRNDAFELWCWRRLSRVSWTVRRSNRSILKEISPEYSLEGWCWNWSSNTLATWCEELIHWKRPWCWERLKAEEEGDDRGWDGWKASLTQWTWVWVSSRSGWWIGRPGVLQSMGSQRVGHDWATELNSPPPPHLNWCIKCKLTNVEGIWPVWGREGVGLGRWLCLEGGVLMSDLSV